MICSSPGGIRDVQKNCEPSGKAKGPLGSMLQTFQLMLQHLRTRQQHLIRKLRGACWFALLKDFEGPSFRLLDHLRALCQFGHCFAEGVALPV